MASPAKLSSDALHSGRTVRDAAAIPIPHAFRDQLLDSGARPRYQIRRKLPFLFGREPFIEPLLQEPLMLSLFQQAQPIAHDLAGRPIPARGYLRSDKLLLGGRQRNVHRPPISHTES
jgi:hypothetical protein